MARPSFALRLEADSGSDDEYGMGAHSSRNRLTSIDDMGASSSSRSNPAGDGERRRGFVVPYARPPPQDEQPLRAPPSAFSAPSSPQRNHFASTGHADQRYGQEDSYGYEEREQQSGVAPRGFVPPLPSAQAPAPEAGTSTLGFSIDLDREFASPVREMWPFKHLNHVQSATFPIAYRSDWNLAIAAPTGCGKTLIMEFAIVRLLQSHNRNGCKIVYLAPMKALCQQRLLDWGPRYATKRVFSSSVATGIFIYCLALLCQVRQGVWTAGGRVDW